MPLPIGRPIPQRVAKRAYDACIPGPGGCLISTYSVGSHGYAQIGWHEPSLGRSTMTLAHRASWTHVNGQIPLEMTVDHRPTCDRRCVNVDHLRLLTNFENARRSHGRNWPLGECSRGHSNDELRMAGGRMRCGPCLTEDNRIAEKKRPRRFRNYGNRKAS